MTATNRFLGGIAASILLSLIGVVLLASSTKPIGAITVAIGTALCGLTMLKYPFATPETVALFGERRSAMMVRWAGGIILAMAIAIAA